MNNKYNILQNNLFVPEEFGISEEEGYCFYFDNLPPPVQQNYTVESGVSKAVFKAAGSDFIIKVPFNGIWKSFEDYDEKRGWHDEEYFEPFTAAPLKCKWNYCQAESLIYEQMKKEGIECFFAKTSFYGYSKDNSPMYIQDLCVSEYDIDEVGYKMIVPDPAYIQLAKNIDDNYFNRMWLARAFTFHGEEKVYKLLDAINKYSYLNVDMKNDNYGYRVRDGSPMLFDYTGFSG